MWQLAGFVSKEFPTHVCKLKKSIYGLKQSLRAWYHCLRDFVLALGFVESMGDNSLFYLTEMVL